MYIFFNFNMLVFKNIKLLNVGLLIEGLDKVEIDCFINESINDSEKLVYIVCLVIVLYVVVIVNKLK